MDSGPINYAGAPYPVRDDFAAAHNRYWRRLAKPGAWLTGQQRVDIAMPRYRQLIDSKNKAA